MSNAEKIWIFEEDKATGLLIERILKKANIKTRYFDSSKVMLKALDKDFPDVVITDIDKVGVDSVDLLQMIQVKHPGLPVIITTANTDLETIVSAFNHGVFEYLTTPIESNELIETVQRAIAQSKTTQQNKITIMDHAELDTEMIAEAPAMKKVFRAIGRLARSNVTVLITGESGTGKELVAKALHKHSPRSKQPFIALNMAAIPHELIESELFGHEKGAFTGANTPRIGRFEQANHGTLFLDEIGDMPAELQTRLLRVLADKEFYPLGAQTSVKVDVRIITATHQNLDLLVADGLFREDLFHRINVIRLHIPPLRERVEDIGLLMRHFLNKHAKELAIESKILSAEAIEILNSYQWPGNVRELENLCRLLTIMTSGREIYLDDLPKQLKELNQEQANKLEFCQWELAFQDWLAYKFQTGKADIAKQSVLAMEKILIETALNYTNGRKHEAAILLGYGRNTLTRKLKELDIDTE